MKRKRLMLLFGIIGVLVLVGGFVVMKARRTEDKETERRTEVVRRGAFRVKLRETGVLEPLISVNVKSNVEGEIQRIFVREGDTVQEGDILIQLDDRRIREEKNQAEANLRSAEAELERARRNVTLTAIRQDAALKEAIDQEKVAVAALEAARKTTEQQIAAAELEIMNTETALEQDQIALNQAKIALRQSQLALERARSRKRSAKVTLDNAEAELRRTEGLYAKKFVSKSVLESAQATYANAKAQYEQAVQDVATQEEAVKSQEAAVASRERTIENRREVLAYQRQNLETLKATRAAVERQAELQLASARTNLERVRNSVEAEKKNAESLLAVAQANYIGAESALKNAQERLEWTKIRAPMSGTVIALVVEEGEIVQSGRSAFAQGPAIMTIADLAQMVVKTYINEADIPKVHVGDPVEITTDAYRDRVFEGRVKEISPQGIPQENVTKFEVVVEVLGSPPELRPGMNVDVDIIVADRKDVVQLPLDTLIDKTKLIARVALPGSEFLSEGQRVELESRAGKRFPGRVIAYDPSDEFPLSVLIDEEAPRGLRVGDHLMALVIPEEGGENAKKNKKEPNERRIEDVTVRVESERKQLVLIPDPNAPPAEKKRSLLSFLPWWRKKEEGPNRIEKAIKVGMRNDTAFEILDGLNVGDEVLVPDLNELISGGTREGR